MIEYQMAAVADQAEILTLNEGAIPAVNRIDTRDLTDLHRQARHLIVARDCDSGSVAGFLLALGETADYASLNFRYFRERYDRFVYVDRIVVSPEHRRLGIGAGLYRVLFEHTADTPRITCEVNVHPPNPGSLAFHTALGFETVDEQDTEGGEKRVALMVKEKDRG